MRINWNEWLNLFVLLSRQNCVVNSWINLQTVPVVAGTLRSAIPPVSMLRGYRKELSWRRQCKLNRYKWIYSWLLFQLSVRFVQLGCGWQPRDNFATYESAHIAYSTNFWRGTSTVSGRLFTLRLSVYLHYDSPYTPPKLVVTTHRGLYTWTDTRLQTR